MAEVPLKIGIIGATGRGDYGHSLDIGASQFGDGKVVAIADENAQGLQAALKKLKVDKGYASYREMLEREKLDIVIIGPRWIDQHADMLLAAAQAGCHVYMEKPFCRTLAECDQVLREFEMRHLHIAIAHTAFYSPVTERALEAIAAGEIGDVLELRGRGKEDQRGGGEDLWVLGSHVLGLMSLVAGCDATTCQATVLTQGKPITPQDVVEGNEGLGPIAGDQLTAKYQFANGITGYFASKRNAGGSENRFALQIFGSKGIIELQTGYMQPAGILRDPTWAPYRSKKSWELITSGGINKPELERNTRYEHAHTEALRDLAVAIREQRSPKCNGLMGRRITELIVAVYASQVSGTEVSLPLSERTNPLDSWKG